MKQTITLFRSLSILKTKFKFTSVVKELLPKNGVHHEIHTLMQVNFWTKPDSAKMHRLTMVFVRGILYIVTFSLGEIRTF